MQHFFVKAKDEQGRPNLVLPASLLARFQDYRWPGNIRELENVIERIAVLARGDEISLADLPDFLRRERPVVDMLQLELPAQGVSLETVEKELILRATGEVPRQPDPRCKIPGHQSQGVDLSDGETWHSKEGCRGRR